LGLAEKLCFGQKFYGLGQLKRANFRSILGFFPFFLTRPGFFSGNPSENSVNHKVTTSRWARAFGDLKFFWKDFFELGSAAILRLKFFGQLSFNCFFFWILMVLVNFPAILRKAAC
jgi:hypothetical protein